MSHDDSASFGAPVDRRKLLGSMAAAVALGLASPALLQQVSAQATPEAEGELPAVPPEAVEFASDWPMAQGNFAATRAAAASTIDSSNVGTLEVAWTLPLDAGSGYGAITSNPLILGDTVFIIDQQGNVQSLDRETGSVNWRTDFDVPTTGPNGIAIGYGRLISVLGDTAEVVCLDPATGEEQWRFQLANHNALGITMAPAIFDGIVYVSTEPGGNTKGNYEGGAEGILFALDITNGVTLWQWNTVKDDAWGNWNVNSGGGLWYPPSVDVETGILYAGIGNAAPFFGGDNAASRPGDNDYANNVVAINPAAGHIEWSTSSRTISSTTTISTRRFSPMCRTKTSSSRWSSRQASTVSWLVSTARQESRFGVHQSVATRTTRSTLWAKKSSKCFLASWVVLSRRSATRTAPSSSPR